jgi:hypothetical protein
MIVIQKHRLQRGSVVYAAMTRRSLTFMAVMVSMEHDDE